ATVLNVGAAKPSGTLAWSFARVAPLAKPLWKAAAEFATVAKTLFGLFSATRPLDVLNVATAGLLVMKRSAIKPWYRSEKMPKPPRIVVDFVTLYAIPIRGSGTIDCTLGKAVDTDWVMAMESVGAECVAAAKGVPNSLKQALPQVMLLLRSMRKASVIVRLGRAFHSSCR